MANEGAVTEAIQGYIGTAARAAAFYDNGANWCNFAGYVGSADYCHRASKSERRTVQHFYHLLRDLFGVLPAVPEVPEIRKPYDSLNDFIVEVATLEDRQTQALERLESIASPRISAEIDDLLVGQNKTERRIADFLRILKNADGDPPAVNQADRYIGKAKP